LEGNTSSKTQIASTNIVSNKSQSGKEEISQRKPQRRSRATQTQDQSRNTDEDFIQLYFSGYLGDNQHVAIYRRTFQKSILHPK